jgi:hypothetical protein
MLNKELDQIPLKGTESGNAPPMNNNGTPPVVQKPPQ